MMRTVLIVSAAALMVLACAGILRADEKSFCQYAAQAARFMDEVNASTRTLERLLAKVERTGKARRYIDEFEAERKRLENARKDFNRRTLKMVNDEVAMLHYYNLKHVDNIIRFTNQCVSALYDVSADEAKMYKIKQLSHYHKIVTKEVAGAITREADILRAQYPGCLLSRGFAFTGFLPIVIMAGFLVFLIYKK